MTAYDDTEMAAEAAAFRRDLLAVLGRIADALAAPITACTSVDSALPTDPSPTTIGHGLRGVGDEGPEPVCDIPPSPRSGHPTSPASPADLASIVADMKYGISALFGDVDVSPVYDEIADQLRTFADLVSPVQSVRPGHHADHVHLRVSASTPTSAP